MKNRLKQKIIIGAMGTLCERCLARGKCPCEPTPPRCAVGCEGFKNAVQKQTKVRE